MSAVVEVRIPAPELRGANYALGACRDLEVCLDGPAGTGKTFAALYKVHLILLRYPGAKALVARKTNTALAGSAIATYRDQILDPNEGVTYFGGNKIRPAAFEYPNGSVMVVQGLDKREKVRSWEFDIAYINEATECDEEDIEFVRMRLRHGTVGYHQLIMDCNPDSPEHWLNQRMESGKTTRLLSRHEDNPRYYDEKAQKWTEAGIEYIFTTLAGLTGILKDRYFGGVWAAAIGAIYKDAFDRARNVVKPFPIPREWPRYMAIDFGYSHPFVCKWYAVDPDGRLYCYREIYQTQTLVEDLAKQVLILAGWFHLLPTTHEQHKERPAEWADPLPREIIADHDAEDRATFEKHTRLTTTPAKKSVSNGIQAMAARLRPAGDGQPRLLYFEDMLKGRDEQLAKQKKPVSTLGEFGLYVWRKGADGSQQEEPVKENDHGCDTDRYMVARFDLQPSSVGYLPTIWR
ncbi:MAG: phage terminase large subunit [Ktedonobacteraceae bacterium]